MADMNHSLLQSTPIFGALTEETTKFILQRAQEIEIKKNHYFFRESDPAECMYILKTGKLGIMKSHNDHDYMLAMLQPGDCFGEMALIDYHNRSASAQAREDCSAIQISIDILQELYSHDLEQFALLQMNLGREVSRRLREADQASFEQCILTNHFITGEYRPLAL